ncbi:MAG: Asp-tRNA(Asn)/Glu-tRNA(Gln) amidotransferase subunit GatA [Phycisphaerae bacterium]|nr:Asp-tRNA(Asn)/Glu-tRNA(Gln) amidotransferase subunit GatA [Phycisphaerae bacterium]
MNVTEQSISSIRTAIEAGTVSALACTEAYLQRIESHESQVKAFTQVLSDRARERAAMVDDGRVSGPLAGVPIAIKDNLCTTFGRTTCGSRMLENFRSPYDATVVRKLEAAGAVILAKTNLDEFAMGSSTENSAFAPTANPWDLQRVPGGSSGGSAAAVAADFCSAAVGSDTGGSIRQPAAFCGVVGLKPTYGLVSRYGLVAFASSLDQVGPLAHNVEDVARLLSVLAGHDPHDSTSSPRASAESVDYLEGLDQPISGLRLGLARQYLSADNDPAVTAAVERATDQYRRLGAKIVEVDLPHTEYGIPAYYLVATAEASSNLARYDGVHYGHRSGEARDLVDLYCRSRAEGFGAEVQRRIMLGTYALSSGYYDAYYLRALKVRRLIRQDFDHAFTRCDAILCPTTTGPAFRLGEKVQDPLQMYLNDVYTVNCNLAGLPGLSFPAGWSGEGRDRLPVGLQLIGPPFQERKLLQTAKMHEMATAYSDCRPIMAA